jgi:hypothetical protein
MFRQAPAEVNPQKDSPKKDPSGRNPAPGQQAGLGRLRSRPIAEASVALCCRIARGFLVLFACRSRAIRARVGS